MWSVKYWNGDDAAHSSPWKTSGTNGAVSTSAAPTFWRSGPATASIRSPSARFPTWSWFWR